MIAVAAGAASPEVIRVRQLANRYPPHQGLDGVSFSVHRSEVLGLLGPNGSAFVSFGSLIASLSRRPDIAGCVYSFTILRLTLLAGFSAEMMPVGLARSSRWLPTKCAVRAIEGSLAVVRGGPEAIAFVGLVGYGVVFSIAAALTLPMSRR